MKKNTDSDNEYVVVDNPSTNDEYYRRQISLEATIALHEQGMDARNKCLRALRFLSVQLDQIVKNIKNSGDTN